MLRPRNAEKSASHPDPLASVVVVGLGLIALALFAAAILAVYTYSTPAVELPLVVAIVSLFVLLSVVFLLGLALRRVRASRFQ